MALEYSSNANTIQFHGAMLRIKQSQAANWQQWIYHFRLNLPRQLGNQQEWIDLLPVTPTPQFSDSDTMHSSGEWSGEEKRIQEQEPQADSTVRRGWDSSSNSTVFAIFGRLPRSRVMEANRS